MLMRHTRCGELCFLHVRPRTEVRQCADRTWVAARLMPRPRSPTAVVGVWRTARDARRGLASGGGAAWPVAGPRRQHGDWRVVRLQQDPAAGGCRLPCSQRWHDAHSQPRLLPPRRAPNPGGDQGRRRRFFAGRGRGNGVLASMAWPQSHGVVPQPSLVVMRLRQRSVLPHLPCEATSPPSGAQPSPPDLPSL